MNMVTIKRGRTNLFPRVADAGVSLLVSLATALIIGCVANVAAQNQVPELGAVTWLRDLDEATRVSAKSSKPILLLFQEIPGCQTCQNFGTAPLSHPLLVEAMEDLFVPLAIHNNKSGRDETVLKKFAEPAWNNPVIRYLDSEQVDLIPRKDRVWSVGGTATRMVAALKSAGREVPSYLAVVAEEESSAVQTAIFAMHCYWEGEGKLGGLSGVLNTKSSWLRGKEVVEVTYDPDRADYRKLASSARKMKCASDIFTTSTAQEEAVRSLGVEPTQLSDSESAKAAKLSDQKYYLRQTELRHLPLTKQQATKINSALHRKEDPLQYLSPRQVELFGKVKARLRQDANSLDEFLFPLDGANLMAYMQRLNEALSN